jgi:hypothetical protein
MWMLPRREWRLYDNTAPTDHLDLTAEVQRLPASAPPGTSPRHSGRLVFEELTRLGVIGPDATELE